MLRTFLLLLLCCFAVSCGKDHEFDCLKSTGKTTRETRSLATFSRIRLDDNINLYLRTDTTCFAEVEAGENLLDGIITEVENGTLYLRNENRCNWVRNFRKPVNVTVGLGQPELISYYGYGDIRSLDTIRQHDFTFDCWNGSGSIRLLLNTDRSYLRIHIGRADLQAAGRSNVSFVYLNDVGVIDNRALSTDLCYLRTKSTGDCRVRTERELEATVDYTGNVYYSGNPFRVVVSGNGTGQVRAE
jgi:hypothetical protein